MKYALSMLAMAVFTAPAFAQDLSAPPSDLVEIVVPDLAAACELSEPPAAIEDGAGYDALVAAQGDVKSFQTSAEAYRECLDGVRDAPDLTEGNEIALNALHDQSVDLEEQVAGRFNEAVKAYKAANPD
ncbi:MAG: hypothetical protein P8J68_04250 [Arenicellaceae bacterium]|nr:hypothetical protein [Arenicellaceae bacterium]